MFNNGHLRSYKRAYPFNMRLVHGDESRKVLVLYTGGTIGMMRNVDGVYSPAPNAFKQKIHSLPELHDEFLAKKLYDGNVPEGHYVVNGAPSTKNVITYMIKEYNPLLDSSNMSIDDWTRIATDIYQSYHDYDSFVVLHGTDTLSYTASALSFILEGLNKTVVVTGSQIPIFEQRSDAKDNFHSALVFAACYNIPEVCVCFANQLFRGNRTLKSSSNMLNAFSSPNYPCLGKVGISYKVHKEYILKPEYSNFDLKLHNTMNHNVGILNIFPTITATMLEGFLGSTPRMEGVIFQSYGIGNIPTANEDLMDVLRCAVQNGVIIVNVTQCIQGTVAATYETGKALEEIGIIPGYDMTCTAALAKLSYVLGLKHLTLPEKKKLMTTNLRGELTPH
ncbi:L-asparaginase isoform X2 [Atheta coriaria]|uniref:L-asparaginase isoform X2 n=1 Tax=Dalotia coriaria TaxID=877792 RepID=UPI0031F39ACF